MDYPSLTKRQREVLNIIKNQINDKGYPPTIREICAITGLKSTSTIAGHLDNLERKGYIKKDSTKPRAIEILNNTVSNKGNEIINIPIVDSISFHQDCLNIKYKDITFPMPGGYIDVSKEYFVLEINSNTEITGIKEGDSVLIERKENPEFGDIIVVAKEKELIFLRWDSESFNQSSLDYEMQHVNYKVIGKITGVFRKL